MYETYERHVLLEEPQLIHESVFYIENSPKFDACI